MISKIFSRWGRRALDLFYPRQCMLCGFILSHHSLWQYCCESCADKLPWVLGPACTHCGVPFHGSCVGDKQCPACIALKPYFSRGRTLFRFEASLRQWVHELKYENARHLFADIAMCFSYLPDLKDYLAESVLVPVPLHRKRAFKRGYNQSEQIARVLLSGLSNACIKPLLIRNRPTASQIGLSQLERQKNVKNAFSLCRSRQLSPRLKYTLIDDVYTTGATLNACAHALSCAGARHIQVLTLAHG